MSHTPSTIDANEFNPIVEYPVRPFGLGGAAQSRLYLMDLPLLLIVSGLVTWLAPSNATFVFGAMVGGLAGAWMLIDIAFREAPLRLSLLLAMSLLVAYNLGALNSWLTVPRAGLTIAEYFTRDPASLARATGACMGAAALLLTIGQLYERPIFGREFRVSFDGRSVFMICLSTLLVLLGYATGQIGYMGINLDESGHVTAFAALIVWWSAPALAFSVCAALNTRGLSRIVVASCAIVQAVALIPTGRRNFAYAILLGLIASRLGRFRSRLSISKKILVAIAGVALAVVASFAFLYLRVAGYGHKEATSLRTRLGLAVDTLNTRSFAEMSQILQANASTRTFNIGYFSDLVEASLHSTPLMGADAVHNLKLMVPSAISADKFGMDPYGEEQLVNMHWGFGYSDEANSLLTAGAADFGIVGVFLYPLLMVLILRVVLEWAQFVMPNYGAVMMALAFIYKMLLAEQSVGAYFGEVRDCLIFAAILYCISIFPRFRWRRHDHEQTLGSDI